MKLFAAVLMLLAAGPAFAQPVQITISQPAEATTMDPGRSTQVLTVNYITNVPPDRIKSIADGRATQILSVPSSRIVTLSINSSRRSSCTA